MTAPFVIRYHTYAEADIIPKSILNALDALPNYSAWSKAVRAQDSVTYVFDAPNIVKTTKQRIEKLKADAK